MSARKVVLGIVLLGTGVAAFVVCSREPPPSPAPQVQIGEPEPALQVSLPEAPEPAAPPVRSPEPRPAAAQAPDRTDDEASLMAELGALGASAPERSLELAREGNARFPQSPGAAQRAWIVAKSLASLGRLHEAQDQARIMVARYPGTVQALDVQRHLLVYPLDQPSREEQQQLR